MPIPHYGVWVATPIHFNSPPRNDRTPHLDLQFKDKSGTHFANINVKSGDKADSRLVFWQVNDLPSHFTSQLEHLKVGFHELSPDSDIALDYLHGGLLEVSRGRVLDYVPDGTPTFAPTILSIVEPILKDAIRSHAKIYVFGSKYSNPAKNGKPAVQGIHDVHMNQGSIGQWSDDNGPNNDGGLIIYIQDQGSAGHGRWIGVFLAFASQAAETDEDGQPIDGSPDLADATEGDAIQNEDDL